MPNLNIDGALVVGGSTTIAAVNATNVTVSTGGQIITNPVVTTASNSGRDSDNITANASAVVITTYSLTTLAESVYTLTVTNNLVTTTSMIFASVFNGGTSSNTGGIPAVVQTQGVSGAAVIKVLNSSNTSGGSAFNGTLKISMLVVN